MSRIDTVSGIPPCVDDTDNHCDYHSVYVHLEVDTGGLLGDGIALLAGYQQDFNSPSFSS